MTKHKLWQTLPTGQAGTSKELHTLVEAYTVGNDHLLDQKLLPYDIQASLAHAQMLKEMGILSGEELKKAEKAFKDMMAQWEDGKFQITADQEDCHTAIEQFLTEHAGEVGKKIHTGRSRNDQSLVMIRLYMKDQLAQIQVLAEQLVESLKKKIVEAGDLPMPGYTHMQKAMPTTVSVWLDSYLSAINDFQLHLKATQKLIDQNPLGSASGFGISNFPIDREVTTKKLGFDRVQGNPMYCAFSRGYFENLVLQALSGIMIIFGRFACDMMLFTTQEFNFFSLPDTFTTGSSIMPQKRNYDLFEIMRGNSQVFHSYQIRVQQIVSGLGSCYHRDLQLTKEPLILGVELCKSTIELNVEVIENLQFNKEALKKAMTEDLYVTDKVYDLVNKGKSFREAYKRIKAEM